MKRDTTKIIDTRGLTIMEESEKIRNAEQGIRHFMPNGIEHSSYQVTDAEIKPAIRNIKKVLRSRNITPSFFLVQNYGITAYAPMSEATKSNYRN